MRKMRLYQALLTLVASSLASGIASTQEVAQSVYYGGSILTMAGDKPAYVEALAIMDGMSREGMTSRARPGDGHLPGQCATTSSSTRL